MKRLYNNTKNGDKDTLQAFENSFTEAPKALEADGKLGRELRRYLLDRHLGEDSYYGIHGEALMR